MVEEDPVVTTRVVDDGRLAAVEAQLAELLSREPARDIEERLARELVEVGTNLAAALTQGLDHLRSELAAVQRRVDDELASVAALLEAQRKELTEALHDVAQETLMVVAEPLRDLTKAREEIERRVGVLNASANAAASRLHALEQTVTRPAPKRRPAKALMESLEQQLREAEERLGQL